MNLQSDRISALCETLKLAGVSDSYPALASTAAETEQSFTDFLRTCCWPSGIADDPDPPQPW